MAETIVDQAYKAWHNFVFTWEKQLTEGQYDELLDRIRSACQDELSVPITGQTLKNWCENTGIMPTDPTSERQAISLVTDSRNPEYAKLWHLADYVVSSVTGPVVWLVPRSK
jgi:hypothetical protein